MIEMTEMSFFVETQLVMLFFSKVNVDPAIKQTVSSVQTENYIDLLDAVRIKNHKNQGSVNR